MTWRCYLYAEKLGRDGYTSQSLAIPIFIFAYAVALGCAVLHQPRILFLDEPTGGVDPIARREFWDLIYEMSDAGTTVFVTTHYMDEAEYCARISIMVQGRITAMGSPGELKARTGARDMQEVFLKVVQS